MTTGGAVVNGVVRVRQWTALGGFLIEATDRGLRAVTPCSTGPGGADAGSERPGAAALAHARSAAEALRRYALGERERHRGPLDVKAPSPHLEVWEHLRAIPFGATTTYGGIARTLGTPAEARAIGAMVGANPICVLVPCHRVLGADGSLRGFAWGLELKRRLLAHEGSGVPSLFPGS